MYERWLKLILIFVKENTEENTIYLDKKKLKT